MNASPRRNTAARNMALGQLYTNEVNKDVLQAMASVKREEFVPDHLKHCAYVDEDLEIGGGRYLIEPMLLGKLLSAAEITPANRVLVVGCLSGYVAAVVAKLAGHVVAIDSDEALVKQARENLVGIQDIDIQHVEKMENGYAQSSPYDVIIIPGAVSHVPEMLGQQLAIEGKLLTIRHLSSRPGSTQGLGRGLLVKRLHHQLYYHEMFDASAALVPGFEKKQEFVF